MAVTRKWEQTHRHVRHPVRDRRVEALFRSELIGMSCVLTRDDGNTVYSGDQ